MHWRRIHVQYFIPLHDYLVMLMRENIVVAIISCVTTTLIRANNRPLSRKSLMNAACRNAGVSVLDTRKCASRHGAAMCIFIALSLLHVSPAADRAQSIQQRAFCARFLTC